MPEQKVGIIAECVCDLPKSYLKEHDIDIVYFVIETDTGVFTDTDEVSADNIITYLRNGGKKARSSAPDPKVYREIFEKNLQKYEDIILVAISNDVSLSCRHAERAVNEMGDMKKRVHIFDSRSLSAGLGHIVIKAVEMAEQGYSAEEIICGLSEFSKRVSTSFVTENVDFLCRSGKCPKKIQRLCALFDIHPVLAMKNGKLAIKSFVVGNYERAYIRYIKRTLRNESSIDPKRTFITHVGCSRKMLEQVRSQVERRFEFEETIVTKASATVSVNCGPNTFGVIWVKKG